MPNYRALLIFSLVICLSQSAYADVNFTDEDDYSGAEFNASAFRESSFDKQTYREMFAKGRNANSEAKESSGKKRNNELDIHATDENKALAELAQETAGDSGYVAPVHDLPGDWVPDKIDLTSNGGFSIAPFNGSPVPYRLNGHVDIERGAP